MTTTTITEDIVLLLHDPVTGRHLVDTTALDRAIAGALLLDLSARGRLSAAGNGAKALLTVTDPTPTGDSLLDQALDRLAGKRMRAPKAVERLATRTRRPALERLAAAGLVRRRTTRALGIFPVTTWPSADPEPREQLRSRLAAVLLDGAGPDQHLALLVSLLHAVKAEHKIVDGPRRALRARAAEITRGEWAGPAVSKAVEAVQAAVMVAVMVPVVAGSANGS